MPEPSPKSSRVGAPPKDADDLEGKKKELAALSAQMTDVTARAAGLAADIKMIEVRIAEAKKVTDAYGLGSTAQQAELDANVKAIGQKWTMALAGAKDQKDAIDKIVESVDDDLEAQSAKLAAIQKSADKAKQDWETAVADTKTKQATYASLQQAQKDTDANLKQIKALIDQASKAELQADIAAMYFLLQQASEAAKDVTIFSPDEYAAKVRATQADVEASKQSVAAKKAILDQQAKQLNDMQAGVAASKADRQKTILLKLKDMKGTAPAPAPTTTAAPPVAQPQADTAREVP